MKKEKRYLVPGDYMADPAVHVLQLSAPQTTEGAFKENYPDTIYKIPAQSNVFERKNR